MPLGGGRRRKFQRADPLGARDYVLQARWGSLCEAGGVIVSIVMVNSQLRRSSAPPSGLLEIVADCLSPRGHGFSEPASAQCPYFVVRNIAAKKRA